jgi:hypothetical protein
MKFVAKPHHFHAVQTPSYIFSNTNKQNLPLSDFSPEFCEIKNFVFAKTYAKVSFFSKESFEKTKSEFRENFHEKTKAKTFTPTLV